MQSLSLGPHFLTNPKDAYSYGVPLANAKLKPAGCKLCARLFVFANCRAEPNCGGGIAMDR